MTNVHSPRTNATLALASGVLALLAIALLSVASAARAAEPTGYGELTRFGEPGGFEGHLAPGSLRARAVGVDPADNSAYLLDEPKEPTAGKRFVRIQKFVANGSGEYAAKASVEFTIKEAPETRTAEPIIEGLAVDSSAKRVYLLAVDGRAAKLAHAALTPNGQGVLAASTLYAYSTVESSGKLVPATGSGVKAEGVVIGPEELKTQSDAPGEALLQPHGITVDPATGEIIVLAHEDTGTEKTDKPNSASDHYVLQRISPAGTLGARYVDSKDVFKEEKASNRFPEPDSPIVVSAGGTEHVYVNDVGLAEVPYDFSSSAPPKLIPAQQNGIAAGFGEYPEGGGLTASEGTIFAAVKGGIKNEEAGGEVGGEQRGGVIAYSGETGAEIGWTGGGAKVACTVTPGTFSQSLSIAAGSAGKVFVLAREFLLREYEGTAIVEEVQVENPKGSGEFETEVIETPTYEQLPGPFPPAVVAFGPAGTGCPQASATPLIAKVSNLEVKAESSIKLGSEVTFSSQLKQADALKVEWDFGDGTTETISTDEFQSTASKPHKYTKEGPFAVTEKIYSDDLAAPGQPVFSAGHLTTPTITVTRSIIVGAQPPKAQFTGLANVAPGAPAKFTNQSSDPNGAEGLPLKYAWTFGDGATSTESSPSHTYATAGTYSVTLTVTDQLGKTSSVSHSITVSATGGGGGGGGIGGGGGTSGGSGSGGGTSGGSSGGGAAAGGGGAGAGGGAPGSGGVLSYTVRLASSTLSVSKAGAFLLKVDCGGASSCTGSAVLRTASAVSSGAGERKAIMTLATGSFAIAGGQLKSLSLHLTGKARALLGHLHIVRAKVSIVARDAAGATHTTTFSVTLRAAKHH